MQLNGQPYAATQYKLIWDTGNGPDTRSFNTTCSQTKIVSDIFGVTLAAHAFESQDSQFVEALKFAASRYNTELHFRVGTGLPGNIAWNSWHKHYLEKFGVNFISGGTKSGYQVFLTSQNAPSLFNKTCKFSAHKGKISDMVTRIAGYYGLEFIVEETEGDFILYQSNQTDADFINLRLRPRAINKKGHAGFLFFVHENVLHFHTPFYHGDRHEFNYPSPLIAALDLKYRLGNDSVWGRSLLFTHDPYTGQSNAVSSSYDDYLKLGDYTVAQKDLQYSIIGRSYHLSTNNPVEARALAQAEMQLRHLNLYQVAVSLDHTLKIKPGDLIKLNLQNSDATHSGYGGLYLVARVNYTIEDTQIKSDALLVRGEYMTQRKTTWSQDNPDTSFIDISTFAAKGQGPKMDPKKSFWTDLGRGAEKSVQPA